MSFNPVDANHRKVCIRLLLLGVASGISATPTNIRMCPPLTTKNWPYYTPVVAVGMLTTVYMCCNGPCQINHFIHVDRFTRLKNKYDQPTALLDYV